MKVSIIGQGYVGLTVAQGAVSAGHQVIGYDIDSNLISELSIGKTHVPGIKMRILKEKMSDGLYLPTSNSNELSNSDIFILAVPTPLDKNHMPDLSYLISASELVSRNVTTDCLVINESTSFPGTLRNLIKPIFDEIRMHKILFSVAPERVDPGNAMWNLSNTPRVISGISDEAVKKTIEFYSSFCESIYQAPSAEVAEASKLFENTFRQVNIALANEFSLLSHKIGYSAHEALMAASTKPFGFMPFYPSIGVGGHCIPVDPVYLTKTSKNLGQDTPLIDKSIEINLTMHRKVVKRIQETLNHNLSGLKIQIAGISYKSGVSDMRESPALQLMEHLVNIGAIVSWHDPVVKKYNNVYSTELGVNIDLGLIVTPHDQIDFSIWKSSRVNVLDISSNSTDYGWPKFI